MSASDQPSDAYLPARIGARRTDAGDEHMRYLPVGFTFDTRSHLLDDVQDSWEPGVRSRALVARDAVTSQIAGEYGADDLAQKVRNFRDLGRDAWSVVASHTVHLRQVRGAFISMNYYPALVGAGTLGERLLNQLVSTLRDDYPGRPGTALIANKESIAKWHTAVTVLRDWGVLDESTADEFAVLARIRNRAVHYSRDLDQSDCREEALIAITALRGVIERLFQPFRTDEKFFTGPLGWSYVRRAAEEDPLIRHFFIPVSALVSPELEFRPSGAGLVPFDRRNWCGPTHMTDEEFARWSPVSHHSDDP